MKSLLLLPLVAIPLLMTGCETTIVERHPRRAAYVERDVVVEHPRYHRDVVVVNPRPRRDVVVVEPRPFYGHPRADVQIRYYTDARGRYYWRDGRRIYVNR